MAGYLALREQEDQDEPLINKDTESQEPKVTADKGDTTDEPTLDTE